MTIRDRMIELIQHETARELAYAKNSGNVTLSSRYGRLFYHRPPEPHTKKQKKQLKHVQEDPRMVNVEQLGVLTDEALFNTFYLFMIYYGKQM